MELLQQYLALTTPEERTAFLEGLTPDQLTALRTEAQTQFDAITGATDDDLAELRTLAAVLADVTAQETAQTEATAAAEAEAQRIRDEVAALNEPGDGEGGDGTGDGGDGTGDGAGDGEGDGDANQGTNPGGDGDGQTQADGTPVPVAAAADRLPSIRALARRAPAPHTPAAVAPEVAPLVASADVPGFAAGAALETSDMIAMAFQRRWDAVRKSKAGTGTEKIIVASANAGDFAGHPEARYLDMNEHSNMAKIDAVLAAFRSGSEEAIAAAGGLCAPTAVRYDQDVLGRTDRPVRDQFMVNFGADRGGVRWVPNPRLVNVSGANPAAVGAWTAANDANPSDPATKSCATFTCPSPLEELIEAIWRCVEFGNFLDRTFRERIDAILQLVGVWHARYAEQRLISAIDGDARTIAFTTAQGLGTVSDVLTALMRATEAWRSYERLPRDMRFAWLAPDWLRSNMRADIAREMPFGTTDERFALADAKIEGWFRMLQVDPVWTPDMQVFSAPVAGTLPGWASTITSYLAPRGTWAFLDGGELDLGLVRDSTLNSTNDFQMFAETFEGAAQFGNQTWKLTMDICPDGSAAALASFDPCSSGS